MIINIKRQQKKKEMQELGYKSGKSYRRRCKKERQNVRKTEDKNYNGK